jgi:hypothetical protein
MARPIRVEFAGAVYHVMARGNQGQKLCADDGDRPRWRATLSEACGRTGWRRRKRPFQKKKFQHV